MKPTRRAGCPAPITTTHTLIRPSFILIVLIGAAMLAGCAQKLVPPDISYDDFVRKRCFQATSLSAGAVG